MNFLKNRLTIIIVIVLAITTSLGILGYNFINDIFTNNCKIAKAEIALNTKIVSKSDPNFYLVAESIYPIKKDYPYAAKDYNYDKCEAATSAKLNFYYGLSNQAQLIYSSEYSLTQIVNNGKNINFNLTEVLEKLIDRLVVKTFDLNSIIVSSFRLTGNFTNNYQNKAPFEDLIGTNNANKWYQLNLYSIKNNRELNKILNINENSNFIADYEEKDRPVFDIQNLKCEGDKCTMTASVRISTGDYKKAVIDLSLENQEVTITGGKEIT